MTKEGNLSLDNFRLRSNNPEFEKRSKNLLLKKEIIYELRNIYIYIYIYIYMYVCMYVCVCECVCSYKHTNEY